METGGQNQVVATNHNLWRCIFNNGWEVDLEEREVLRAVWQHRCVAEGWETGPNSGQGMVGKRVICIDDKKGVTSCGSIVGHLRQGPDEDDVPLWHCLHDDGDREDLDEQEAIAALRRWQEQEADSRKAAVEEAARSKADGQEVARLKAAEEGPTQPTKRARGRSPQASPRNE